MTSGCCERSRVTISPGWASCNSIWIVKVIRQKDTDQHRAYGAASTESSLPVGFGWRRTLGDQNVYWVKLKSLTLRGRCTRKANAMASRLHFALDLTDMEPKLVGCVPSLSMHTYMFDGEIVCAPAQPRAAINAALAQVWGSQEITFSVETYDTLGGSRQPEAKSVPRRCITPLDKRACGQDTHAKTSDAVDAILHDCHQPAKVANDAAATSRGKAASRCTW